jgi:alpha-1,2-mannosyltransferase
VVKAVLPEAQRRPAQARAGRTVTVLSAAAAITVLLVTMWGSGHFFDLGVYRGAVRYWLVDGGDLYAFRHEDSPFGFTYPPFAALVLSPLAAMSWPVTVVAAAAASIAAVVLLLRWLLVPILRRHSWPVWAGCALVFCALLVLDPVRATLRMGQINLVLLALICFDQHILRRGRWAGIGIGIAAAIKLVPAVFIGYLVVTRQYRAAVVATGTAAAVTLLAGVVAPGPSHTFWTDALWNTDRVGPLADVANQSIRGVVARLDISSIWWLAAVVVIMAIWCVRVRRAAAVADLTTGFALTGVLGCLISPVSWVHHLVFLVPALVVCLDAALAETDRRRRRLRMGAVVVTCVMLSIKLGWLWWGDVHGWAGAVGSNMYVWVSLALLVMTPIRPPPDRVVRGRSAD